MGLSLSTLVWSKLANRIVLLNSSIPKPSGNIGHNSAPSIKVARVPVYSEKLFSQDLEFILMIIDRFRLQESGAFNYCILIRFFYLLHLS